MLMSSAGVSGTVGGVAGVEPSLAGSIIRAVTGQRRLLGERDVFVYAAEELRFGRPIALKVLRDEVAGDAEFVAAVRDQAYTLAMAAHVDRGLPRVYECGTMDTGELFIALERTRGATLREVLDARGPLDPSTALRIASQVGEALETLHHNRIVHGQLAPDSVLLARDNDGVEHIALVGVEVTAAYRTTTGLRRRDASPPAYLAPEQVERGETTDATDQYALGMLLRELLTADRSRETTGARAATPPLPPEIERIITTALDPRPSTLPGHHRDCQRHVAAQTVLAETRASPASPNSGETPTERSRPRRPHVASALRAPSPPQASSPWLSGSRFPAESSRASAPQSRRPRSQPFQLAGRRHRYPFIRSRFRPTLRGRRRKGLLSRPRRRVPRRSLSCPSGSSPGLRLSGHQQLR